MATASAKKKTEVENVTLTLDRNEAEVLLAVMGLCNSVHVSGDPTYGVYNALLRVGGLSTKNISVNGRRTIEIRKD